MAKGIKRKLDRVYDRVDKHIRASIDRSNKFSAGLSGEGYNGGYRDALADVMLALNGTTPNRNGWWNDETDE